MQTEYKKTEQQQQVVVAMSGGVDSSAAALMLYEQGYAVIGVAMQVWDYRNNNGNAKRATCCAPADFDDARSVAEASGFPFYVFDFEDSFHDAVIAPFVKSYLSGLTPNPCLECNRKVKFYELRARARSLGVQKVATGHYAQIKELKDGSLGLFTSEDSVKDQSYFLYAMTQQDLKETLFPVGHLHKSEVRNYLRSHAVRTASKEESQDICFVPGSVADFVERKASQQIKSGIIQTKEGTIVGQHAGIHRFTVGQRKGLGVSHHSPLYVLQIDQQSGTVLVGDKDDLAQESFIVSGVNWISAFPKSEKKITALVKLRYRHPGVLCELELLDDTLLKASFIDEWTAVCPGQAAVFYSPEEIDGIRQVYGGGIIQKKNQKKE